MLELIGLSGCLPAATSAASFTAVHHTRSDHTADMRLYGLTKMFEGVALELISLSGCLPAATSASSLTAVHRTQPDHIALICDYKLGLLTYCVSSKRVSSRRRPF